jgi:hypothetical protein
MYRYCDKSGNVFELHEEERRLVFAMGNGGNQASGAASAQAKHVKPLDAQEFMQLVSAFSVAIDNKVFHRELRNSCSGMIITWENGQQRRYILSDQSQEMKALEMALYSCIHLPNAS